MYPTMKTKLKGGSLSGTYMMSNEGGVAFIRKECRADKNREYGYQRWYSQLKRLQRYNQLFPSLFPQLKGYGIEGTIAYYDMEIIDGITSYEFIKNEKDKSKIEIFFRQLAWAMQELHKVELPSKPSIATLYFKEEVEQKLYDCQTNIKFWSFLKHKYIYFNGEKIPSLVYNLRKFSELFERTYKETSENFSHGNMTLENILYNPKTNRVVFIDPYEENIIDSSLADYSQIMQSCNSKYEMLNELENVIINDNNIEAQIVANEGMEDFNKLFIDYITSEKMPVVRLLEISQFVRMLPFKMNVDEKKMFLFYGLASKMASDL